jgi:hypothetical protein
MGACQECLTQKSSVFFIFNDFGPNLPGFRALVIVVNTRRVPGGPVRFVHSHALPRSSTMGPGKLLRIGLEVAHVSGRHGSSNNCRGDVPKRRKRFGPRTSQRSPVRPQSHSPISWHRATRLVGVDEAPRELQPKPRHPCPSQSQTLEPRPKARPFALVIRIEDTGAQVPIYTAITTEIDVLVEQRV